MNDAARARNSTAAEWVTHVRFVDSSIWASAFVQRLPPPIRGAEYLGKEARSNDQSAKHDRGGQRIQSGRPGGLLQVQERARHDGGGKFKEALDTTTRVTL